MAFKRSPVRSRSGPPLDETGGSARVEPPVAFPALVVSSPGPISATLVPARSSALRGIAGARRRLRKREQRQQEALHLAPGNRRPLLAPGEGERAVPTDVVERPWVAARRSLGHLERERVAARG